MTAINDTAATILAAVVAGITAPPSLQYVSPGKPPADCEQVVVYLEPAGMKFTGPNGFPQIATVARGGGTGRQVTFGVDLTRCVPTIKTAGSEVAPKVTMPKVTELNAAGRRLNDDVVALFEVLAGLELSACNGSAFVGVDVGARSGGFQTITGHLLVAL